MKLVEVDLYLCENGVEMREVEQEAQRAAPEHFAKDCRVTELLLAQPLNHLVKLEFKAHVPEGQMRPRILPPYEPRAIGV